MAHRIEIQVQVRIEDCDLANLPVILHKTCPSWVRKRSTISQHPYGSFAYSGVMKVLMCQTLTWTIEMWRLNETCSTLQVNLRAGKLKRSYTRLIQVVTLEHNASWYRNVDGMEALMSRSVTSFMRRSRSCRESLRESRSLTVPKNSDRFVRNDLRSKVSDVTTWKKNKLSCLINVKPYEDKMSLSKHLSEE